jgi:hypothetical protein
MYTLLEDVDAETAADLTLRSFLGQQKSEPDVAAASATPAADACCVPSELPQSGSCC